MEAMTQTRNRGGEPTAVSEKRVADDGTARGSTTTVCSSLRPVRPTAIVIIPFPNASSANARLELLDVDAGVRDA